MILTVFILTFDGVFFTLIFDKCRVESIHGIFICEKMKYIVTRVCSALICFRVSFEDMGIFAIDR